MDVHECRIGRNIIKQMVFDDSIDFFSTNDVVNSWEKAVYLESTNNGGLRSPQKGALFAIKAHWTVSDASATIVMPTGTGKTETIISTVVSEQIRRTLVLVPSDLLRKQTADKFVSFGILYDLGVIDSTAIPPIVAVLNSTPKSDNELSQIVEKSNVVIATVSLLRRFSDSMMYLLSEMCELLVVDEAHHIAAKTWDIVKTRLENLRCLQFTATPFRNDGKKLDGKIIYNFPLLMAQNQGYFQKINYNPIWEFDDENADIAIASAAIEQLNIDTSAGYEHVVLVRAKDKKSACRLYNEIYLKYFSEYNPVLIYSGLSTSEKNYRMALLKSGSSKIVVCVDMFGEGIDIPNLKIAAIHDKYKSLPITLQFIGRFARTSKGLGEATLITNIANDDLNESLKDLYAQDADWNFLLQLKSSEKIGKEISEQEFVQKFDMSTINGVGIHQIRPKVSMTAYHTFGNDWHIDEIKKLFENGRYAYTVNYEHDVLVIIERIDSTASWTSFRGISDTTWNLHLAYWNRSKKLLFVNSTIKGFSDLLAKTLCEDCTRIKGESVFRCLYGINRLMLGTVGLLSAIDGPIRFKMFAGIDVEAGISESLKHNSYKSNLFGIGYNGKGKVSIGCSHKGRIWSKWVESISYWISWCDEVGVKLLDESIDTKNILSGVLVPVMINERPLSIPYEIEWPQALELIVEDRIEFNQFDKTYPYYAVEIELLNPSEEGDILFKVGNMEIEEHFKLEINDGDYLVSAIKSVGLSIRVGRYSYTLSEYFQKYPPRIKFVDQSVLEGNFLVRSSLTPPKFQKERITVLDWSGTDIKRESQTKEKDPLSIQYRVIQDLKKENIYDIIFDDDGSGEIADIVTIRECNGNILFGFFHCKFSSKSKPGSRISDLYAVCGQAEKSVKWCSNTSLIIERLIKREKHRQKTNGSRIELGSLRKLNEIKNKLRLYPSFVEITIVQPGVDSNTISEDMLQLLGGTSSYLMETYGIDLKMVCS